MKKEKGVECLDQEFATKYEERRAKKQNKSRHHYYILGDLSPKLSL
jgi:hypothetical protein